MGDAPPGAAAGAVDLLSVQAAAAELQGAVAGASHGGADQGAARRRAVHGLLLPGGPVFRAADADRPEGIRRSSQSA